MKQRAHFSDCASRSVVIIEGTPNRATQFVTKALATDSTVMVDSGMASGQRVKRSIHVSR